MEERGSRGMIGTASGVEAEGTTMRMVKTRRRETGVVLPAVVRCLVSF